MKHDTSLVEISQVPNTINKEHQYRCKYITLFFNCNYFRNNFFRKVGLALATAY
jgi:hypothetical protein